MLSLFLIFQDLGDAKYDHSLSLQPKFLGPLDLSRYLLPKLSSSVRERGVVHLHDKDDFYEADLWMWNLTLSGLSKMFLHEVNEIDEVMDNLTFDIVFRLRFSEMMSWT